MTQTKTDAAPHGRLADRKAPPSPATGKAREQVPHLNPGLLGQGGVLALQRLAGNKALTQLMGPQGASPKSSRADIPSTSIQEGGLTGRGSRGPALQRLVRSTPPQGATGMPVVQRRSSSTQGNAGLDSTTVSKPTNGKFGPSSTYEDMRSQVTLKPGKGGVETAKDTRGTNSGLLYDYAKKATLRAAQIRAASDTLGYDYISLSELVADHGKATVELNNPKLDTKRTKHLVAMQKARGLIVNEWKGTPKSSDPDFEKAALMSREWAAKALPAVAVANEERANVEMLHERVDAKGFGQGGLTGRVEAQEAKMSLDRMTLQRNQLTGRVEQLNKLGRVQGAGGKIADAAGTGAASFLLSIVTLGIVALEKQVNPLGYKGKGWSHHSAMPAPGVGDKADGFLSRNISTTEVATQGREESNEDKATRLVLMEDLFGKVKAVKKLLNERAGGASALDWLSGLLFFVGDGILQSLIALGSRIAIWLGLISFVLGLINVPAHGALSPVIAVTSALAMAITYVRLALSAVKLVITTARLAVDSLNMAINSDPRMATALKARTIKAGSGLIGDTMQVGGLGLVLGGDTMMGVGHHMTNAFNPVSDVHNVAAEHSQVLFEQQSATHTLATGGEQGFTENTVGDYATHYGTLAGGAFAAIFGVDVVPAISEVASPTAELYNAEHRYIGGSNPSSHEHTGVEQHDLPQQGPPIPPRPRQLNGPPNSRPLRQPLGPQQLRPPQRPLRQPLGSRPLGPPLPPRPLRQPLGSGPLGPPSRPLRPRGPMGPEQLGPMQPDWMSQGKTAQTQMATERTAYLKKTAATKVRAATDGTKDPSAKVRAAGQKSNGFAEKLRAFKDFFKKNKTKDIPPEMLKKEEKNSEERSRESAKLGTGLLDSSGVLDDFIAKAGKESADLAASSG